MARLPHGAEILPIAQQELAKTKDAAEIRVLQAVIFPLANGMSIKETAEAVGRSPSWVNAARNKYIRECGFKKNDTPPIRNHAFMSLEEEEAFLAHLLKKAVREESWWSMKSIGLWKSILGTKLSCRPHIICFIGMAGERWHPTSATLSLTCKPRRTGKKLPERLARIQTDWERPGPIRLMFQDEARFGRIAETRRCWSPKPERPVCPTMVSQESTYAYGAVSIGDF